MSERQTPPYAVYGWDDPPQRLRGIGPRWAEELAEKGVRSIADIVQHLPFRYEDRRRPRPLAEAEVGQSLTAVGLVRNVKLIRPRRRRLDILQLVLDDGTAAVPVIFFNRAYLADYIQDGTRLLVHGTPRAGRRPIELHGPEFELLKAEQDPATLTGWIPVYEKLGPLSSRRLRSVIEDALRGLEEIPDPLPPGLCREHDLPGRLEALRAIHRPEPQVPAAELQQRRTPAHKRLAYEEFFWLELGLAVRRARLRKKAKRGGYTVDAATAAKHAALLPFELTGAQKRVLGEIYDDLQSPWPMSRLLLGDVGSGKTAVAALSMLAAVSQGFQAALMAPTEILAHQHARNLQALLAPARLKIDLLSASLPAQKQRLARERMATHTGKIVVGTHSLISEKVSFARLGQVVIDEQHRFGVVQRADLVGKGENPDVLVMSATPIPRTLAMVMYGDLDVSIIDEKPPGRQPIRTVVRTREQFGRVHSGLQRALNEKRQVYVVHPAVEETASGMRAAEQGLVAYRELFPQVEIAMVHGRMKSAERQQAIEGFARGDVRMLIATTVIEVGIDIPAASVILVEDADRFGLAQLHQLRGRVGRGDVRSYCVLIASEDASEQALERLRVLEQTDDGFRVAEKDLEMRGPGEFAGTAQSGYPSFRVADIVRHQDLLLKARDDAFALVDQGGGDVSRPLLREAVLRHGERLRLADVG